MVGSSLPDYPFPELSPPGESLTGGLGLYGDILLGAEESGILDTPTDPQPGKNMADRARLYTAATRLWLLGYLDEKPEADASLNSYRTPSFRARIREFQAEARLPLSGQVDEATWYALDELVSFETELSQERMEDRWYEGKEPLQALLRAAECRLHVLGMGTKRPKVKFRNIRKKALTNFVKVNLLFGIAPRKLRRGAFPETLATLFDQDLLVDRIASSASPDGTGFVLSRVPKIGRWEAEDLTKALVVNVAKVELWLLGFDIQLNGELDYGVRRIDGRPRKRKAIRKALTAYWRELEGCSETKARRQAGSITSALFLSLQNAAKAAGDASPDRDDAFSDEIVAKFNTPQRIDRAIAEVRSRGLSLWDGLKRVWRWFRRGVKKIATSITKFFANLARIFFRYATKAFKIVQTGVKSVIEGVDYYLRGGLKGPDNTGVVLNSFDFDVTVFAREQAEGARLRLLEYKLALQTSIFSLGSRILGVALSCLRKVALGITGWARLILSLAQSLRQLKALYRQLKWSRSEYDRLRASAQG